MKIPAKKTIKRQPVAKKAMDTAKSKPAQKAKRKTEPKPKGRPTKYTPELAAEIVRRISMGESTRSVGRDETMPTESTIRAWAIDDKDGFFAQYTRAVQIRAIGWSEEIIEISDDGSNDTYIDENGNERTNNEIVARSRIRVDSRKWMLSKVLPKVFGDKLDVNHGVQPDNPLQSLLQRVAGTGLPIIKENGE